MEKTLITNRKLCGHFWKVEEIFNILPNCKVVDLTLRCTLCGAYATASAMLKVVE